MRKKISMILLAVTLVFTASLNVWAQGAEAGAASQIKRVTVMDNGVPAMYDTKAGVVAEFFTEVGITLAEQDIIDVGTDWPVTSGMLITISRCYPVTIKIIDNNFFNYQVADVRPGSTVGDAVRAFSEETGRDYIFDKSLESVMAEPGMLVVINAVTEMRYITNEEIPYGTEYIYTDTLPEGSMSVVSEGVFGTVYIVEEVRYEGSVEMERRRITAEVTLQPVNRVVAIGTKPGQGTTVEEPVDSALLIAIPGEDTAYNQQDIFVADSGETYAIALAAGPAVMVAAASSGPVVDGIYFEYSTELVMSATAYTADYASTGKRPGDKYFGITASGLKAQVGVVSVDPSVIPLLTKLYIEGYGYAIAGDTGKSVKGNIIDLFFDTPGEVKQFGRQNRRVFILSDQEFEIAIKR